jgi:porphobilinogen synthase
MNYSIPRRPRRLRQNAVIRGLVRENYLLPSELIFPVFVIEGQNRKEDIKSMPGIARYSMDLLAEEMHACQQLGINTFNLYPALTDERKDKLASESLNMNGLFLKTVSYIRQQLPDAVLITDVAMDPYSTDGHDGLVKDGLIVNDESVEILARMAVAQAAAGAQIVGPSDMMDGRIGLIRHYLDEAGYTDTAIMAYTAKYASAFYGPFRDALDSAPRFGDKKTYQMDFSNANEALVEAALDLEEGADFLMVKPGLPYLDVISLLASQFDIPIAAFNVSGEYAMIKAAAANGWIDGKKAMVEALYAFKRAGAKVVLTYFAKEYAQWFRETGGQI